MLKINPNERQSLAILLYTTDYGPQPTVHSKCRADVIDAE